MNRSRRNFLVGVGGATLALPLLESFPASRVKAQDAGTSFAFFLRQANGVQSASNTDVGAEPERFWPREVGALTDASLEGRALGELAAHKGRLLAIGNVNMKDFNYGDGHARGAMQALTARGPVREGAGGSSEAAGESLDHRIGRELNPGGRDSLFMYAGQAGGWLGGACISYRGPGERRSPLHNPQNAYETVAGAASETPEAAALLQRRQKSINDLVRGQMTRLLSHKRLSAADKNRLDLHFSSVRDIEVALSCRAPSEAEGSFDDASDVFGSTDGNEVWKTARLHIDIATLAIACGFTRSAALQIGNGNDGATRFRVGATLLENYHFISHRRQSHDSSGAVIAGSDLLHHEIDKQFAQLFKYMLDKLASYEMPDGKALLDHGVAVWHNDNANGPGHSPNNVPFILAGSAGGYFKQGEYVQLERRELNHARLLNTIGGALGLKNQAGGFLDDFGDASLAKAALDELKA